MLSVSSARAEVRRMEAVGSEPIHANIRASRPPRDAAVERALLEAVSRVASEFLLDALVEPSPLDAELESFGAPESPGSPMPGTPSSASLPRAGEVPGGNDPPVRAISPDYPKIFGRNLVQYTARYRILEDRGERPALFAADDTVESEYVVIVEVYVDALRVKRRLEEIGLLAPPGERLATRSIVLEVRGLQVYPAYEALKAVLLDSIGASRVVALEFAQSHVRLGVEYADGGPAELLDALYASSPRELEITPVLSDEFQLTISVHWISPEGIGLDEPEGLLSRDEGQIEGFTPRRRSRVVDPAAPGR